MNDFELIDVKALLKHISWMNDDTELTVKEMKEIIDVQPRIPLYSQRTELINESVEEIRFR